MLQLEFRHRYRYDSAKDEIVIPIILTTENRATAKIVATVDTGASDCVFERFHADSLRLDLEAGARKVFRSAGGPVETYGHTVRIASFDMAFESVVYFFADPLINKNLLGRFGWLDRIRLGIVDYDRQLYLAPYDS